MPLPPPTRDRYTQGELHEDAAELLPEGAGLAYAGWHWQSHQRSFDRSGAIVSPLMLHWGGDRAAVRAGLGAGPEGFAVTNAGADQAFVLDRSAVLRADGTPYPADAASVRRLFDRLDEPVDRSTPLFTYPDPTPAEAAFLAERLVASDLDEAAPFAAALASRRLLDTDQLDALLERWLPAYADLTDWPAWSPVLTNLLAVQPAAALVLAERIGPAADEALADAATGPGLALLLEHARADEDADLRPWLRAYATLRGTDAVGAAAALVESLPDPLSPARARSVGQALGQLVDNEHWAHGDHAILSPLVVATDERLPLVVRRAAAYDADELLDAARGELDRPDPVGDAARAAVPRFEALRAELMAGAGPDLTMYEGHLSHAMAQYRRVSPDQAAWLHERLRDPAVPPAGTAFCLEVLYAHGLGTTADVDALAGRWKRELAKDMPTTYVDWRHPLVTLTALACELEHPLGDTLLAWWQKTRAKWARAEFPLVLVAEPTAESAATLAGTLAELSDDLWRTWVLVRARAEGRRPADVVAPECEGPRSPRTMTAMCALVATYDLDQPLWHHGFDESAIAWFDRALEVAEDETLSAGVRRFAYELAAHHRLIAHPDHGPKVSADARERYQNRMTRAREDLGIGS